MRRKLQECLIQWKETPEKNPLLLVGARCVGKTYLALDFAANQFSKKAYLNFEHSPYAARCFMGKDPDEWKKNIESLYKISLESDEHILILDEIPDFIYFIKVKLLFEKYSHAQILMISSRHPYFWEVQISTDHRKAQEAITNFLNKNFIQCTLYPLDFEEFLDALGDQWYIPVIRDYVKGQKPLPEIVHRDLIRILDRYLVVGGMPEAVSYYIQTKNVYDIPEIHKRILASQEYELRNTLEHPVAARAISLLQTMDIQWSETDKNLQYKMLPKNTNYVDYQQPARRLVQSFLQYELPPEAEGEQEPKRYYADVGMLISYANRKNRMQSPEQKSEFAQAILRHFIMENLLQIQEQLYFWESPGHTAKIDFILKPSPAGNQVMRKAEDKKISGRPLMNLNHMADKTCRIQSMMPIQIVTNDSSSDTTYSRNLFELQKIYPIEGEIKLSAKNIMCFKNGISLPLYAVCCLKEERIMHTLWQAIAKKES